MSLGPPATARREPQPWVLRRPGALRGTVRVPGDKSISHRALLLHALAVGEARIAGLNAGADVAATRSALRALGLALRDESGTVVVQGRAGRLAPARAALDCANSGTTLRLLAGLLAAQPFTATLDGDASLRRRPMARITEPLRAMGAQVDGPTGGRTPPLIITGGALRAARFELPVASAQVKSCLLLAAAAAGVGVEVVEPLPSRDHTERMLAGMGASLARSPDGRSVRLRTGPPLRALSLTVPGDPSSAALLAAAALSVPGSRVALPGIALNPGRTGFLAVLRRMGAAIAVAPGPDQGGEPTGDLIVEGTGDLAATDVQGDEVPALLDEVPALAVVCAFATGTSRFRAVGELRVKESDRLAALRELLAAFSIRAWEEGDDLVVAGGAPQPPAELPASDDHRIVMAGVALALGALARAGDLGRTCRLPDATAAAVSFPAFRPSVEALASDGHA